MRSFLIGAAALFACGLAACGYFSASPRLGTYRAVVDTPGGELPFQLDITKEDKQYVLYLINGAERMRVPDLEVKHGEVLAHFPGFENSLRATIHRKRLDGEVTFIKNKGVQQTLPFHATYDQRYRFFEKPTSDNADVAGRWEVTFVDDAGEKSRAVAEFQQSHDQVTGTFLTPSGDHRFLAGQVRGDELFLSSFSGGQAHLYKARVGSSGSVQGDYWSGVAHERWEAKRNEQASVEDATSETKLSDGGIFNFTFPGLDHIPVSLSDMRFQGKVVVVTLAGSWCPNCHDEAAFLAPLYKEYRERGLEIVALMFERAGDFDSAVESTRRFRDHFGIEYTTLIAGTSDTDAASKLLPSLDHVYAFPTTLFIDRQGLVRKIHTGFAGPATGAHYAQLQKEFRGLIEELLQAAEGRREARKNYRFASAARSAPYVSATVSNAVTMAGFGYAE